MATVVIYSTRVCAYCVRAKQLLERKGVEYTEIAIDQHPAKRIEMQRLSGRSSVPQIFIDDQPIGGFTDMWALEVKGELDELLGLGAEKNNDAKS